MHVEVTCPEDYMGDIIADINKKRGRILGMEPVERGEGYRRGTTIRTI